MQSFNRLTYAPVLVSLLILLSIFATQLIINNGPIIKNDSYQYISVANNFLEGHFAKTSIVHFNFERSHTTLPAPITTFPFGYSLLITPLLALGIPGILAASLFSMLASIGVLILLNRFSRNHVLPISINWALLGLYTFNAAAIIFSISALTEATFTFVSFWAILNLIEGNKALIEDKPYQKKLLFGFLLVGISYWIRYAGIFLCLSVVIFQTLVWLSIKTRNSLTAVFYSLTSCVWIIIGFFRNWILVGNWKGGNEKPISNNLIDILDGFLSSSFHLIFGPYLDFDFDFFPILCTATIFIVYAIAAHYLKHQERKSDISLAFLCLYVSLYSVGLIYAGTTTVISFGPRMFVPLIPCFLAIFALTLKLALTNIETFRFNRQFRWFLVFNFIGYCLVNISSLNQTSLAPHFPVLAALQSENISGETIFDYINKTDEDTVFIANKGQPLGHVIQRSIISLVSSEYSQYEWNELNLISQAKIFNAKYLILFNQNYLASQVVRDNQFLRRLVEGHHPPWLELVLKNDKICLYKISKPD